MNPVETRTVRVGIVAGEASGDILGAGLIRELRQHYPNLVVEGIAGPLMQEEGASSLFPMERLSVMGLVEPLKRLPELLGIRRSLVRHFTENPPDVFIGIDSPDFNLSLEEKLRRAGVRTVHYVSPSVWAWRQGRIKKIARAVDHMLALLPFEARFYEEHDVPVTFVGHPLADKVPLQIDTEAARASLGIDPGTEMVAMLPGSRGGEVKLLGPLFIEAARWCLRQRPALQFVIPAASPQRRQELEAQLQGAEDLPITLVDGRAGEVLAAADAVLIASGTATLEAMLYKKPMVVAYRLAPLSYAIFSRMIKTPWVALPNLLAQRELVPEIMQDDATPESLGRALLQYFTDPVMGDALSREFDAIHQVLRRDASGRAAAAVASVIEAGREPGQQETEKH
ncbi:lipid-A-disaccharide synthase [Biformimicrobium ophioploci]|uniref:Lipid-A-disaccharide synthase n=1 Tax=Biformimicrobium ophioploci TaxID=3036711 RepID=A0ABQ6LZP8_9GAMM|nr:lipid-A-disaccharide synthase [Microbulbifer sp. NKW57]GMG87517.1 lipid-A-disaccharide synthase [Microbulbifer sp. NKW57]